MGSGFELGSNTWNQVPWAPPHPDNPLPNQYWGDLGMAYGVYHPVSDQAIGYTWDGDWGSALVPLSVASGTWNTVLIGFSPYDDELRNAASARM